MKRKKNNDSSTPKTKRNRGKTVDCGFTSLFSQTQTSLFKDTTFEAGVMTFKKLHYLEKTRTPVLL
ncbi:hypothetical protein BCV72DRAFT_221964 [Rhizopus microsporus var. microsporus]|uniref:Uncharacterized protein n=2 Tax=Rhizopus microsporus TaxID=58291 RepID=A0A2G4T4I3_RHIZD|nr:uncharacterized protein RHIMIDRAFT_264529 [Rhizopus microsporus ATCC 52813]ORE10204.1 hypothetical protein BCV72DRAFT_221964 [Rhizopus microsporus var. microsporus]PHZ15922.1 hypothetical protein RHIMIDRAFT_264529 [Rhizopus microsporus ATCC 52813]